MLARAQFLSRGLTGDGSASKLAQVVGRIHSLMIGELKFSVLAGCQLEVALSSYRFPTSSCNVAISLGPLRT